jgi:hypothetical protein
VELVEEELVEPWVLDPVEVPVCVLDVDVLATPEEELETVELWVVVELVVSGPLVLARFEEPPAFEAAAPSASAGGPLSPIAVSPPPASAESAARRAQRRGILIGILSSSCSFRPLSA